MQRDDWDRSYRNGDNFLYWPHDEVVRFISHYVRKRTGIDSFRDRKRFPRNPRALDLGCGIGRHVRYFDDMGLEADGIDFSNSAIEEAKRICKSEGRYHLLNRLKVGSTTALPYRDNAFDVIAAHGVLDSMRFDVAKKSLGECLRVIAPDGLVYIDLVSGDDSAHSPDYSGEEVVTGPHESGTIQTYFNFRLLDDLIAERFELISCNLVRKEELSGMGGWSSRYHVVLRPLKTENSESRPDLRP